MTPSERTRLIKCLNLLSSDCDNEGCSAGRAADRLIREASLSWDHIIITAKPEIGHLWDWRAAAHAILSSEHETEWERSFCWSLLGRWRGPVLTARQEETLRKIHKKYFKEAA